MNFILLERAHVNATLIECQAHFFLNLSQRRYLRELSQLTKCGFERKLAGNLPTRGGLVLGYADFLLRA